MGDQKTSERGQRVMSLSSEFFRWLFAPGEHGGYRVVQDGIPADADVERIEFDRLNNTMRVWLSSSDWLYSPGDVPSITPVFEVVVEAK